MERPVIDREECTGCGICIDECPNECLEFDSEDIATLVNAEACDGCGTCEEVCPTEAITMEESG
ncbi:MAG: 4Fe-4S dicluster domain-containing protein [Gaiellales bacterium]|nr:MAG: 4Fe-4S dicluster domain-containing protein [Gaiellales bacterium]